MTTYVRSADAARLLGVTPATLYAYVSRGRIARVRAADGRTSLFAVDDIETLRSVHRSVEPASRPSIDVQITSSVTHLGDDGIEVRGWPLVDLAAAHSFEDIAELLWTGDLPEAPVQWKRADSVDVDRVVTTLDTVDVTPISRLSIAATVLGGLHPDDDGARAARRLVDVAPYALGSTRRTGRFALRLTSAWKPRPTAQLVDAVDTALVLLADHELATSTLAVRIAASVRASPYSALTAGLATIEGALHGSAAMNVHRMLDECAAESPAEVVERARRERRIVPGFGHKVYRRTDPRFEPLLETVRSIAPTDARLTIVDELLAGVVRTIPTRPNVDFALGALTWLGGLPADAPIFAVARIAGWSAHYAEELAEAPVRFRGLARTPT